MADSSSYHYVYKIWTDILGENDATVQAVGEVFTSYSEDHRHYHTVDHISSMLRALELSDYMVGQFDLQKRMDLDIVNLAAIFHDVVLDPKAPKGQNEYQSAEYATRVLTECGYDRARTGQVGDLIACTIEHRGRSAEEMHLIDADLDVLSDGAKLYEIYCAQIRREYGFLTDEQWRKGRTEWIERMLERTFIYHLDANDVLEHTAQNNLRHELRALKDGRVPSAT